MSPAKMAHATIETTAARATTGSSQYVIGTKRATDMVAVRPGIDPINTPAADASMMAIQTEGSVKTS